MTFIDGRRLLARRDILRFSGVGLLVAAGLAGCESSPGPSGEGGPSPGEVMGREAPMLAALVDSGELPPVDERLPVNPLVVEPAEEIGRYGGKWRTALLGPADTAWLERTVAYDHLMRWTPDWAAEPVPNIAESVDVDPEGREFVFHLREGLRWSDGAEFTADDLVFACEDVLKNPELYPGGVPSVLISGGEPARPVQVEELDTYTVRFEFDTPHGLFLVLLATPRAEILTALPKHYLSEFHQSYNEDVEGLARGEGFSDWTELFHDRSDLWANPDLPRLYAWVPRQALGEGTRVVLERNPYYWKVDSEGRQLPYFDEVDYALATDGEVMLTQALSGEIDMHIRHFNTTRNRPVLAREREAGGYEFFEADPIHMNTMLMGFNLNHKDPALRDLFQTKDFRIGLSYAINRAEIIDAVYARQGEPWQASPRPGDPMHNEQLAKQYTEYNVDRANDHLDRAGLTERDGDGFRLRPDGEQVRFTVLAQSDEVPGIEGQVDALDLVRGYWREVGINANVQVIDRGLYRERTAAGEHDAATLTSGGGRWADVYLTTYCHFPSVSWSTVYAYAWMNWYLSGGAEGESPPDAPRRQMELYDELKLVIDPDERTDLMQQILQIAADEFYLMGINLQPEGYGIVKNNFRNVPHSMPLAFQYPTPGPTNPEQYFVAEER